MCARETTRSTLRENPEFQRKFPPLPPFPILRGGHGGSTGTGGEGTERKSRPCPHTHSWGAQWGALPTVSGGSRPRTSIRALYISSAVPSKNFPQPATNKVSPERQEDSHGAAELPAGHSPRLTVRSWAMLTGRHPQAASAAGALPCGLHPDTQQALKPDGAPEMATASRLP